MVMRISLFGQLGLKASSQGRERYDDDDNTHVWPTWAVGVLSDNNDLNNHDGDQMMKRRRRRISLFGQLGL
jgi:hypothetical protein